MSIDFFLITCYFFSCFIALGKVFRKMLSKSISAYTWPFPLRILNIHYLVGCMPWFLADQVDSLYLLHQTVKLVKDFVVIIAAVVITWLNQRIFWYNCFIVASMFIFKIFKVSLVVVHLNFQQIMRKELSCLQDFAFTFSCQNSFTIKNLNQFSVWINVKHLLMENWQFSKAIVLLMHNSFCGTFLLIFSQNILLCYVHSSGDFVHSNKSRLS